MGKSEIVPHAELYQMESGIETKSGSQVYHLDELRLLDSMHDGRRKSVIINEKMVNTSMLVDILTYRPDTASPLHYHKGAEHFFFVLSGRGHIEIEGQDYRLKEGTCVWVQDGDKHKLYSDPDSELRMLEYFSSGKHETVFLETSCAWQQAQS